MGSRYLHDVKEKVLLLQSLGVDIALRNSYGLYGVCSKDESRDYSVLFQPKELLVYLMGFQYAYVNRDRLKVEEEPVADALTADSQPVEDPRHRHVQFANGEFCTICGNKKGDGLPCLTK